MQIILQEQNQTTWIYEEDELEHRDLHPERTVRRIAVNVASEATSPASVFLYDFDFTGMNFRSWRCFNGVSDDVCNSWDIFLL